MIYSNVINRISCIISSYIGTFYIILQYRDTWDYLQLNLALLISVKCRMKNGIIKNTQNKRIFSRLIGRVIPGGKSILGLFIFLDFFFL